MKWFRLYNEFATDPKVQMMSEAMQRRLIMLFCMESGNVTETLHASECEAAISFYLRISDEEREETKRLFLSKGFIDDEWNIVNWEKRQFSSDSSTERVSAYRKRKKQECNDDVTLQKQKCNATDTEQIQKRRDTEEKEKEKKEKTMPGSAEPDFSDSENPVPEKSKPEKPDKSKPVLTARDFDIPDWMPPDAWTAFFEMRRANKKPPTHRACELLVAKLDGFRLRGFDVREVLEKSTINGWQDVYEPKPENHSRSPPKRETVAEANARIKAAIFGKADEPYTIEM